MQHSIRTIRQNIFAHTTHSIQTDREIESELKEDAKILFTK